jgi:sugar phosphate permease
MIMVREAGDPGEAVVLPAPSSRGNTYRWVILGVGTGSQVIFAVASLGLSAVAPQIRSAYGLQLGQIGLALAAVIAGQALTQLAWGMAVDRFGDRATLCLGLWGSAVALTGSALAGGFTIFLITLVVCGMCGASINVASTRAVATWFSFHERGFALGIRQSALPLGGALAAFALPAIALVWGLRGAFLSIVVALLIASAAAARWVREPGTPAQRHPLRFREALLADRRAWRLAVGAALLCVPQFAFLSFTVLYLHDEAGISASLAALVLAVSQLGGAAGRVLAGRWSDGMGQRVTPLRRTALVMAVVSLLAAATVGAPAALAIGALIIAGTLSSIWNGLAFAAAIELARPGRSGLALGFQSTVLTVTAALTAPIFALLIAATSWRWSFALLAPCALLSHRLLRPLLDAETVRPPTAVIPASAGVDI